MSLLTIVLFLLGLGVLLLGWRWQSPQNNDLLTALKGLVHLKHELSMVKDKLQVLEKKIDSQVVINRQRPVQKTASSWNIEPTGQELQDQEKSCGFPGQDSFRYSVEREGNSRDQVVIKQPKAGEKPGYKNSSATLPEKYVKVIELANSGLSIREIANHLTMSQDAVSLVLSTYPKGGIS